MPTETKIFSVARLVTLLDQNLFPNTNLPLRLHNEHKRNFFFPKQINGTLLRRFKFSTQIFDLNFQLSLPGMFGNGTLVDLLRFDKVVQARTKVPSKGPVRRAGDWNRRSGTSLGSIGAARAHLRAHAHWASSARTPATRFGNLTLSNTFSIDARQALETPSTCVRTKLSDPRFGSRCRGLLPKVFIQKIFNRTFLLILYGSRRDLI